MFTWVFFRAKGFTNSMVIFQKIFNFSNYDSIATPLNTNEMIFCWVLILILLLKDKLMMKISIQKTPQFYLKFVGLLLLCYFLGVFSSNQFIYFQF
jgi:hypothetical protein